MWKENKVQLRNGCIIEAFGAGKKIRGRRNRSERPTLIIFDDVQSIADVRSEELRTHAWLWATQEVIPAGDESANFLSVGSALHREAVAVKLGQLAGWSGRTYKAIHRWPERMDLWEEFTRLATNLADDNRKATAMAFYAKNRAAMDKGAMVYWPEKFPIAALMLRRAAIGPRAFQTEYQGVPGTPAGAVFPPEYFDRAGLWFDEWPTDLVLIIIALDPSKARTDKSDWQAHVIVGLGTDGTIYADCELHPGTGPGDGRPGHSRSAGRTGRTAWRSRRTRASTCSSPSSSVRRAVQGLVAPIKGIENYSVGKERIERLASYFDRQADPSAEHARRENAGRPAPRLPRRRPRRRPRRAGGGRADAGAAHRGEA